MFFTRHTAEPQRFQISLGKTQVMLRVKGSERKRRAQWNLWAVSWMPALSASVRCFLSVAWWDPLEMLSEILGTARVHWWKHGSEHWTNEHLSKSNLLFETQYWLLCRCLRNTSEPKLHLAACFISSLPVLLQNKKLYSSPSLHSGASEETHPWINEKEQSISMCVW